MEREDIELEKAPTREKPPVEEEVTPEPEKDKYQRQPKQKDEEEIEEKKLVIPKVEVIITCCFIFFTSINYLVWQSMFMDVMFTI